MFTVSVIASIFIVLVIAPVFIVPKALYLRLGLIALYYVSEGIKSTGGILDAIYSPFNKLST
jgi:hypothetical protein